MQINQIMMIKEKIYNWLGIETNPSKRIVLKNLNQIKQLLEEDSPYIAKERIKFLITDIENNRV
jgi:hypothetical protein